MITYRDRKVGLIIMKSAQDMANPKRGVYDPVGKTIKEECPGMMTHEDQEVDRVVRASAKDLTNRGMGVCPSMASNA